MRFILLLAGLCLGVLSTPAAAGRPLVAVIDSGIAKTPELQSVVVAEHDMAASPARPPFQPRYDHGTMVATILNREAKGAVDIISIRIDDPAGCAKGATPPCQPSAEPIARAIRKATELGVTAINISLNLADDPMIADAVRDAANQGIMIVLAAGNDGKDHPGNLRMAIAGYPKTVLVGALDCRGRHWSGSNRPDGGAGRDYDYVWRLGVDVPARSAKDRPVTATGTSFAAPIETARRVMPAETLISAGPSTARAQP